MAFELEALVGHLYVAGGRTIHTTPPGALCEVAPSRAARGREIDTLFVLVLPSGSFAPKTFYEQMALMAAERYFSMSGSVTSALRDVYNTLNHNLYEHNHSGRRHYEANMIAVVMRGEELYVARTGAAVMVLQQESGVVGSPVDYTDDDALFTPPLGVQPIPEVEMSRHALSAKARMMLVDANITEIVREKALHALRGETLEDVLDAFKLLVTLQLQMMVVEFVQPDEPVMVPAATGQSTAVLSAEIAAARARIAQTATDTTTGEATTSGTDRSARGSRGRMRKHLRAFVANVMRGLGHGFAAISTMLHAVIGRTPTERGRSRNRVLTSFAVVSLPVIVFSAVLLSWVFNVGQTAYEECVARARQTAELARTIDSTNQADSASIIRAWESAQRIVDECHEIRPDSEDPVLDTIEEQSRAVIDTLNQISRRAPLIIHSFPEAALIEIVRQGLDLYVLDTNRGSLVYRVQLREDGRAVASPPQPIANMRTGTQISSFTVDRIVSIAFDTQRNRITALDRNGVLISCRPQFINQCEAQQLQGTDSWVEPIAMRYYVNNLYVMDRGANQLWRYEPIGTTTNYDQPPQEYFSGSIRDSYNFADVVDFVISNADASRGHVYILYSEGYMTRHLAGQPVAFQFGFPSGHDLTDATLQAMYINDTPIFSGFYFVSRPTRTIYKSTLGGSFDAAFRLEDEDLLERVTDVVADEEQGLIYAISGNTILAFARDD